MTDTVIQNGNRPGRPARLDIDQAQARYDAANAAVAQAEKDERRKGAAYADARLVYDGAKAEHRAAIAALENAEEKRAAARKALRDAQGRVT